MYRVLKPGGRLLVLEFSKPIIEPLSKALRRLFIPCSAAYWRTGGKRRRKLPLSGGIHSHAPGSDTLKAMMQDAAFENAEYFNMTAGVVALHRGYKF